MKMVNVQTSFERLLTINDLKSEERKQKLSRYRKKKIKRNFGRKIKVSKIKINLFLFTRRQTIIDFTTKYHINIATKNLFTGTIVYNIK